MKTLITFFTVLFLISLGLTSAGQSQVRVGAAGVNEIFNDVRYDPIDGGMIQAGRIGTGLNTDIWLVKLNSLGVVVWQNTIVNAGEDVLARVRIMANGNYLICGWFNTGGGVRGFAATVNRTTGAFIWMRTTTGSFGERFYDVIETAAGNIALVGSFDFNPAATANTRGLFVLLNSVGTELNFSRSRNNTGPNQGQSEFFTINQLPNGDLLITGHYYVGANYSVILTEVNETNTVSTAQRSYVLAINSPLNNNFPLNSLWQTKAFTIGGNVLLEMGAGQGCCSANGGVQAIYNYNLATRQLNGNLYYHTAAPSSQSMVPISATDMIITQTVTGNNFVSRIINNAPNFTRQIVSPISNLWGAAVNNGNLALSGATTGATTDGYAFSNTVNVPAAGGNCAIQNATAVNVTPNILNPANDAVLFTNRGLIMAVLNPNPVNPNLPLVNMCPLPCDPNTNTTVTKCRNVDIVLPARAGTTYLWAPSAGLSSTTVQNPTCSVQTSTQYTVTVFNAATNCTNNDIVNVVVNDHPISNLTDTSVCNGDTIQLIASGGTSYSWTPNYNINNTSIFNPLVWPTVTTTYVVNITNDFGCSTIDSITVTVNDCRCEDSCNWSLTGNTFVKPFNFIGSLNNADFKIRTNNTQRAVVTAAGDVGINTPTPAKLLHVNGEARIGTLPPAVVNDRIVFANNSGDLRSLAASGNTNEYLSGNGTWQPMTGGSSNPDQGLTLNTNNNTIVLGDVCNAGGGKFTDPREINMNNLNLYFNSSKNGKLYMGTTEDGGHDGCRELQARLEISSNGLRAINEYTSPLPSTSGLRFTDMTARNTEPLENRYNGVLSLDEDGDVIWVKACCGKDGAEETKKIDAILTRLTALEKELAETKMRVKEMDLVLDKNNIVILGQNTPNPFHESTKISYYIPKSFAKAQIVFTAVNGIVIKTTDITNSGNGTINVFANDLSSGLYSYSLFIDGKLVETKKMVKQ